MNTYEYVIVGNSAGGLSAAREIRTIDQSGGLLILSDEQYPAYSRPLIAKHISHTKTIEAMELVPREFYVDSHMEWWPGTRAVRIDYPERTVLLHDGRCVHWNSLLLATGSSPIVPPIEGVTRQGVHTFTTYCDAESITRQLPSVRHVVVIGGGFIGLSAADALRHREVDVTIVEMQSRVLSTMVDEEGSTRIEEAVRASGADVITGRRVVSINGDHPESSSVSSVTLDDRTRLQCEMVILAVGVRPRTELAEGVVPMKQGILVDEFMRTATPGIYACGDVCQTRDFARDADAVLPVWPNAVAGGAVAGATMAGMPRSYEGSTTMNAVPYFGLSVVSAGVVEHDPALHDVLTRRDSTGYTKVVLKEGVIVGMVSVGDTSRCGIVYHLMKRKANVDNWKDMLVREDFGILSLPDSLWRDQLTPLDGRLRDETDNVANGIVNLTTGAKRW